MARRRYAPVPPGAEQRERLETWRRSVAGRYRRLVVPAPTADQVERHVRSRLLARASWSPAGDFSRAFAVGRLVAQHIAALERQDEKEMSR